MRKDIHARKANRMTGLYRKGRPVRSCRGHGAAFRRWRKPPTLPSPPRRHGKDGAGPPSWWWTTTRTRCAGCATRWRRRATPRRPPAGPGEVARLVETRHPALAVLDLVLPGADGIELMRTLPSLVGLPVILVSAYSRGRDHRAGSGGGCGRLYRETVLAGGTGGA